MRSTIKEEGPKEPLLKQIRDTAAAAAASNRTKHPPETGKNFAVGPVSALRRPSTLAAVAAHYRSGLERGRAVYPYLTEAG